MSLPIKSLAEMIEEFDEQMERLPELRRSLNLPLPLVHGCHADVIANLESEADSDKREPETD